MDNKRDVIKESASIIEEIESKLEEILAKKKEEVDRELEENIKQQEQEAKKKLDQIEKEIEEDKEALSSYRSILSEFESEKEAIKTQIKTHLSNAIQLQPKIATMAEQTLQELKRVSELNQKLEDLQEETLQKAGGLKKDLEERYDIQLEVPRIVEEKEKIKLEDELSKLEKIKELLSDIEHTEGEAAEVQGAGVVEAAADAVFKAEEPEKEEPSEAAAEAAEEERADDEVLSTDEAEELEESKLESQEDRGEKEAREEAEAEEPEAKEVKEKKKTAEPKAEEPCELPKTTKEELEKYLKANDDISYYENDGRIVLNGEAIIESIQKSVDEAKKLYGKLAETDSPKEQFFVKQEIIWHQEVLRELMLISLRMCEKENCSLPRYTKEILNGDVIKGILEKVSMENWSNKEYFTSFEEHVNKLKESFTSRISPPDEYYGSIYKELMEE